MDPLRELRDTVMRHAGSGPIAASANEALGARFFFARCTPEPSRVVYEPVFNLVVEGEKRAVLSNKVFACR